ncbi:MULTISPECIES: DUF6976 family protein [Marinobacter]|uniref:DUF6976 family protein n=1 Tax=Marinobacter TaxID=2742 RepID=UPI003B436E98|nr:hypothetical protein PBN92_17400 [Marinobacter alkaliphilus]
MSKTTQAGMMTPTEAAELIKAGRALAIAGDEALLATLPRGTWVGGSTPYFMTGDGGQCCRDRLFVQDLGDGDASVNHYDEITLRNVLEDAPENGYSIIILPAGSKVLEAYAHHAPEFPDMYLKPIVGWVSGVHLDELAQGKAVVFDGRSGECFSDRAVVLHVPLDDSLSAVVHIVNLFEAGTGPELTFEATSRAVGRCRVDGQPHNFADLVLREGRHQKLPLVADYCGAMVNVSIQSVDEQAGVVNLYAPVFEGVSYRFARPVEDYPTAFLAAMPDHAGNLVFGCNCILNYLYSELEGRTTAELTGPITFGEVAYQLLNQTAVFLTVEPAA